MGAWGIGPFENDGAGDFEAQLCHFHPENIAFLRETFEQALADEEYLEVDVGQAVIACAALLAAMRGLEVAGISKRLRGWMERNAKADISPLIPTALAALDAVMSDGERSEIYELWEEGTVGTYFQDWK